MNYLLKVTLFVTLCVCLLQGMAIAKECWECPSSNPCSYSVKVECNTCSGSTWCINGHWYSGGTYMCTTMACSGYGHEIENPFKEK